MCAPSQPADQPVRTFVAGWAPGGGPSRSAERRARPVPHFDHQHRGRRSGRSSSGRDCQARTSSSTESVILEIVSWELGAQRALQVAAMSRTVIPPSSHRCGGCPSEPGVARRWHCGHGARRGGRRQPRSPGLSVEPLREFDVPRPPGSPFSQPRCAVCSAARPRSSTVLIISGRNRPSPVSASSPTSARGHDQVQQPGLDHRVHRVPRGHGPGLRSPSELSSRRLVVGRSCGIRRSGWVEQVVDEAPVERAPGEPETELRHCVQVPGDEVPDRAGVHLGGASPGFAQLLQLDGAEGTADVRSGSGAVRRRGRRGRCSRRALEPLDEPQDGGPAVRVRAVRTRPASVEAAAGHRLCHENPPSRGWIRSTPARERHIIGIV